MRMYALLCLFLIGKALPAESQDLDLGTGSLDPGPPAMQMLLEKTIFKVDILTLELRFDSPTVARLAAITSNREISRSLRDSVSAAALAARDVWARIHFVRGISLNQFVDAAENSARRARDAGLIGQAMFDDVSGNLPHWYAFLKERRIQEGDEMFYRIRGDTLRTVYRGFDGSILLDRTDTGAERRLAVMGGYFAPGSDFRKKLIESLFEN